MRLRRPSASEHILTEYRSSRLINQRISSSARTRRDRLMASSGYSPYGKAFGIPTRLPSACRPPVQRPIKLRSLSDRSAVHSRGPYGSTTSQLIRSRRNSTGPLKTPRGPQRIRQRDPQNHPPKIEKAGGCRPFLSVGTKRSTESAHGSRQQSSSCCAR